jgi:DNA transformation protein and related proteins
LRLAAMERLCKTVAMPALPKPVIRTPLDEFATYCMELLNPLGMVRAKKMFGGCGLYVDGLFIALIAHEQLYLKVDDITRAQFETAGCQPFVFETKDKPIQMNYYQPPADTMESPALMLPWARWALEAALRARLSQTTRKTLRSNKSPAQAVKPRSRGAAKSPSGT